MIVGLLLGLALALGVALYVTKVPMPFINKVPQRTRRTGRGRGREEPATGTRTRRCTARPGAAAAPAGGGAAAPRRPRPPAPPRRAGRGRQPPAAAPPGARPRRPTPAAAAAQAAAPGGRPVHLLRAGRRLRTRRGRRTAARQAVADGLGGQGHRARAVRPQVFRVRVGPFDKKDEADAGKEKLEAGGIETALVRVQR